MDSTRLLPNGPEAAPPSRVREPRSAGRIAGLDVLRFVAVVLVLGRHLHPWDFEAVPALNEIQRFLIRGGWCGVDLFFVLSGFLVSGLLYRDHLNHGTIGAMNFLIRRGVRIYPLFWLLLAATAVVERWRVGAVPWPLLLREVLFVQNYAGGFWNHTWSLAVEEHFYLLLLAGVTVAVKLQPRADPFRHLPAVALGLMVACLVAREVALLARPGDLQYRVVVTHARLDAFACGATLSYWWHFQRERFLQHLSGSRLYLALPIAGAALILPAFLFPLESGYMSTVGLTQMWLGAACLTVNGLRGRVSSRLARAAAFLGRHSYALYLVHQPVNDWLAVRWLRVSDASAGFWGLYCLTYFGGTVLVGTAVSLFLERRILDWRDRVCPSRSL